MAKRAVLEQVTLAEQYGDCGPLDQIPAGVVPSLDVGGLNVRNAGAEHVEVLIEFDFDLSTPREEFCGITAAFRLVYRMRKMREVSEQRDFAAKVAVVDAWSYWRSYLTNTMTLMGLQPLHLPPEPPAELEGSAREAFDISIEAARKAEEKAARKNG